MINDEFNDRLGQFPRSGSVHYWGYLPGVSDSQVIAKQLRGGLYGQQPNSGRARTTSIGPGYRFGRSIGSLTRFDSRIHASIASLDSSLARWEGVRLKGRLIMVGLDSVIQGILALVLVIGLILCHLITGKIPDILSFSLASVIAFYFGSRVGRSQSRGTRSTDSFTKVVKEAAD